METEEPKLTPPPIDPMETPQRNRKVWYIVGAAVIVLVVLPLLVGLIVSLRGNGNNTTPKNSSSLADVALADNAKVNLAKLPSGKTLFFTMMQRAARQQVIAGEYGLGHYSVSQGGRLITDKYQLRSDAWKNGTVSYDYADLPSDPSSTTGFSLSRCVGGVSSSYTSYVQSPAWQQDSAALSKQKCGNRSSAVMAGDTRIDGLLAGGLSKNQATVWVDLLAASQDSKTHQALFTFDAPTVTTLDGKQAIALNFHLNNVADSKYCASACGVITVEKALEKASVNPATVGYNLDTLAETASGTYYLDPATLLPQKSQISTTADAKPYEEYRKLFQYQQPDFLHTSTTQPAATPELITGFTVFQDTELAPPPAQ